MRSRGLTIALTVVASAIMFATMPQFVRAQVTYIEFSKLPTTEAVYDINAPLPASNLLKQYGFGITSSIKTDFRLATARLEEMFAEHSYDTVRLARLVSREGFDYFAERLNSKHKQTMRLLSMQNRFADRQVNNTANGLANAGLNARENFVEVVAQTNENIHSFVDGSVNGIKKSPAVMVRFANHTANYALDRLTNVVDAQTQQIANFFNGVNALKNDTVFASSGATLVSANLGDHPLIVDMIPNFEIDSSQLAIADSFQSEVLPAFDFTDYRSLNQIEQSTPLKTYIKQNLINTPESLLAIYESKIYTRPTLPQVDPGEIYAALPEIYLGTSAQGLMESKIQDSPKFAFTLPGENIDTNRLVHQTDSLLATSTNILKKFVLNDFSEVYYRVVNAFNTSEQTQFLVDARLERVGQFADYVIAPTKRTMNLALNTSIPLQFSSNGSFLFDKVDRPQQIVYRDVTPRVLGESTTSWWQTLLSKFTGVSQTTTVIYPTINEPVVSPVPTVQSAPVSTNTGSANLSVTIANTIRNILNSGEYTLLQGPKGDTGAVGPQGLQGERGEAGPVSVTNINLPEQYDALTITALNSTTASLSGNLTLSALSTAGLLKNDASGVVSSLAYGDNGECLTITLGVPDWGICGGGGGADADATYIVQTATDAPTNAQVLASLATGLLKNTTTTGVLSVATAGTDYVIPSVSSLSSLATVGTITSGTWQGTAVSDTYIANDLTISGGTINNSAIGGVTPSTAAFTSGSYSGALAANGGITFDAATDTLGAFTANGTIDLATNILTNIGNAGTDFVAGTGALTLAGDLTITGDDLFMTTNTSGFILVADGTNFNPVAMSGDITIDSTGATSIGADKVTEADLKAVDAASDEECLTYESTTGDFEWQTCGSGTMSIGGSITSATQGSILFAGASGVLAQDNASLFFNDSTNDLGIGISPTSPLHVYSTDAAGSEITLNIENSGASFGHPVLGFTENSTFAGSIIGTTDTSPGFGLINGVTISAARGREIGIRIDTTQIASFGVLSADGVGNAFTLNGTFASAASAQQNAMDINLTTAGSAAQRQVGISLTMAAGYTGSSAVFSNYTDLASASTGNNLSAWAGNFGYMSYVHGTTSGLNVGSGGWADNGNTNIAILGQTPTSKASATNVGVMGHSLNGGASGIQIGGYFGLVSASTPQIPTVSGALIANNGSQTSDIFVAQDNASAVFSIINGGNVGIGDTTPDDLLNIHSASAAAGIAITSLGTDTDPYIKYELADGTATFIMGIDDSDSDKFKISTTALGTSDRLTLDSSANLVIGTTDLNAGSGPVITIGINNDGTTPAAGSINFQSNAGTAGYVWQDTAGNMRIHTAAPTNGAGDILGTVIGTQSSTRETKQNITSYTDYAEALQAVVSAPLHTFKYKKDVAGYGEDSPLAKARLGFIADEVDGLFMWGNAIDQVSVNGLLMGSVKALDQKISLLAVQSGNKNSQLVIEPLRYVSEDSVGQAKILAGSKTVRINFDRAYEYQPIVTISARGEEALSNNFRYSVIEEDESGFTIKISSSQNDDIEFSWHAFASEGAKLSVSDGSTQNIILVKAGQSEEVVEEDVVGADGQVAGDYTTEPEIIEEVLPTDGFFVGEPDVQTEPVTEPIEEGTSEPAVETPQEESLVEESSPQ